MSERQPILSLRSAAALLWGIQILGAGLGYFFPSAQLIAALGLSLLFLLEAGLGLAASAYKLAYLCAKWLSLAAGAAAIVLLWPNRFFEYVGFALLIFRGVIHLLRLLSERQGYDSFIKNLSLRPAATLVLSFALVISAGTVYLSLPFATKSGQGLELLDALFTAASAVCVTGLIVVDTASTFSAWGQAGILVLIQIGGLGLMIFTYAAALGLRRRLGLEDKLMMAFLMNEKDLSRLSRGLRSIVRITLSIEAAGALILAIGFFASGHGPADALWLGLFHAVSGFCNAGFALFSDSLVGFQANAVILLGVGSMIILGGISFPVLLNFREVLRGRKRGGRRLPFLTTNTRLVLVSTGVLLFVSTMIIYVSEMRKSLADMPVWMQYLNSFFQGITLRTAGFNSLDFAAFGPGISFVLMLFMFVGGASGSTAGGLKVNTLSVLGASIVARFRGQRQILVGQAAVPQSTATNSLFLFFFAVFVVCLGLTLLLATEDLEFLDLAFETVSAFGTVGLSRGITGALSDPGRIIIIGLMFVGRVGPLTLITALGREPQRGRVVYPEQELMVG